MSQNQNLTGTPLGNALAKNKKGRTAGWIMLAISLPILLIGGIIASESEVASAQETISSALCLFSLAILIVAIVILVVSYRNKIRIQRSYCPYCGEHYDYDSDVSWEVQNVTTSIDAQKANVAFECLCSNCGNTTVFTTTLTTATLQNGQLVERNIYAEARKYFK